jgi:NADPH2:quinone reductase
MRAVSVAYLDGPDAAQVAEVEDPQPSPGEVLIDVYAAGVSFPDLLLCRGQYQIKPELPFIPGFEVAGTIRSAPEQSELRPGDRVAAFSGFGGFAEQVCADAHAVFLLPQRISFLAGAALPLNYLTAHFALTRRGRLQPGEIVLVHGAAGGIGTAAVQLAHVLGARVIAVVSTQTKAEVASKAGADEVIFAGGFRDAVAELTAGRGVDVVVDPVGADRFTDSLRSLAPEGRLLVVGFTGGEIPTVKVNRLLLNNIEVVGVGWGEFWRRQPDYLHQQWAQLLPHLRAGTLDPVLGSSYPLERAGAALRDLDERRAVGKIILQVR